MAAKKKKAKPGAKAGRGKGRPFQPGESGNPGGRPKGFGEFRETIREHAEKAVNTLVYALADEKLRVKAAEVLLAYAWGKPMQAVEVTGKDGGPMQSETKTTHEPPSVERTAAILRALAQAGALPVQAPAGGAASAGDAEDEPLLVPGAHGNAGRIPPP